jgi:hypothetical protein
MNRFLVLSTLGLVLLCMTETSEALCLGPCKQCTVNEFGTFYCEGGWQSGSCACQISNIYGYCDGVGSCTTPCWNMPNCAYAGKQLDGQPCAVFPAGPSKSPGFRPFLRDRRGTTRANTIRKLA